MVDELVDKIILRSNRGEALVHYEVVVEEVVSDSQPFISIVIPAFNEESRIGKTLSEWMKFLDEHFQGNYEVLVLMDGCADSTVDIVLEFAGMNRSVVPFVYSKKLGKGGALIEAFKRARGEFIFFTDADASLPVDEFMKFIRAIRVSDLAIGCRYFSGSGFAANLPVYRLVLSRVLNVLLRIVFAELKGVYDTQCGAKAVRKNVVCAIKDDLFITDFAFDVNLIYSALRRGFIVREVYVDWNHVDDDSKVSGNIWKTSFTMFLSIVRLRIYYSRFRQLMYSSRLKGLFELLMKVVS